MFASRDSQGCSGKGEASRRVRGGAAPRNQIPLVQCHHQSRSRHRCRNRTVPTEKTVMVIPATRYKSRRLGIRTVSGGQNLHRLRDVRREPHIL